MLAAASTKHQKMGCTRADVDIFVAYTHLLREADQKKAHALVTSVDQAGAQAGRKFSPAAAKGKKRKIENVEENAAAVAEAMAMFR